MGIEPTLSAWKAKVLPLNYARVFKQQKAKDCNSLPGAVIAAIQFNELLLLPFVTFL
jgi:hypothetical protein